MLSNIAEQNLTETSGSVPVPSVRVVRARSLRVAVVLDTGVSEERYQVMRQSLYSLVTGLPRGAQLSVVIYSSSARLVLEQTLVTRDNMEGVFGRIPGRNMEQKEESCLECALNLANTLNSSLIVVMSDGVRGSGVSGEIGERVGQREVHLVLTELEPSPQVEQLVRRGGLHLSRDLSGGRLLSRLRNILQEVVGGERQMIHREEHRVAVAGVTGSLVVDSCRTESLRVEVIMDNMVDVEMFHLEDPQGEVHKFPTYQHGVVFFQLAEAMAGTWNYKIKMFGATTPGSPVLVQASAFSSCQESVVRKVWTNSPLSGVSARQPPLVVYTQLSHQLALHKNVTVTATVLRPGSTSISQIDMTDTGTGYPDTRSGDGIYSGYFTEFTTHPGFYTVTITVSSPVRRYHTGTQFFITEGVQHYIRDGVPQVRDIFPPSRITDLTIHKNDNNKTLYATLEWTAPGGDYDSGHAHRYQVKVSTEPGQLSGDQFSSQAMTVQESLVPVPQHSGTHQSMTVGLPWPDNKFYYGIVAVDQEGNASPVSNIVEITAPPVESAISDMASDDISPLNLPIIFNNNNMSNSSIIYIISGAVCGLLFIVAAIFIAVLLRRRISSPSSKMSSYLPASKMSGLPDIAVVSRHRQENNTDDNYDYNCGQERYVVDDVFTRESLGSDRGSSSTSSTEYSAEELYGNSLTVSLSSKYDTTKSQTLQVWHVNHPNDQENDALTCVNPAYASLDTRPVVNMTHHHQLEGHVYENYHRPSRDLEDGGRPRQESLV